MIQSTISHHWYWHVLDGFIFMLFTLPAFKEEKRGEESELVGLGSDSNSAPYLVGVVITGRQEAPPWTLSSRLGQWVDSHTLPAHQCRKAWSDGHQKIRSLAGLPLTDLSPRLELGSVCYIMEGGACNEAMWLEVWKSEFIPSSSQNFLYDVGRVC